MDIDQTAAQPIASESEEINLPDTPEPQDELALARDLVLRAHPEVVHELVTGASLAELLASIPAAAAAFARVVQASRETTSVPVPGGGAVRSTSVNVEGLGPMAKIRAGLGRS